MSNKVSIDEMRKIIEGGRAPKKEEVGQADLDGDKLRIYNTTLDKLSQTVTEQAGEKLKPYMAEVIAKVNAEEVGKVEKELSERYENTRTDLLALAETVRPIEIKGPTGKKTKLNGVNHYQFENLLKIVGAGQAVLLVGPAGTGKSHAAEKVSEILGLGFHAISVGSQTSKSDLIGYMTATGDYVRTQFREAYEHGGIFLLDEADAGNSNVLILLNAALSNGQMAFPDGMVSAHADFRMIGTANTFGNGASRQYVGRNQLDAATLDRFAVLNWNIDDRVEEHLSAGNKRWLGVVRAVRKRVLDELELRVVISPRATQRGSLLLAAGMSFEDVMVSALTGNIPDSSRSEIENLAKTAWDKGA